MFATPFPRPPKLSDPGGDFTDKQLDALLATPDEEWGWQEFRHLFHAGLPAGDYREAAYFLPYAFGYLEAHPDDGLNCIADVVWFMSEHAERLASDGLDAACEAACRNLFKGWTREFRVLHFDSAACAEKGWRHDHADIVEHSEIACMLLSKLARFRTLAAWAHEMLASLAQKSRRLLDSAWFLEFAKELRADILIPDERLYELLTDRALMDFHARVVRTRIMDGEPSPTYWPDTLALLGLNAT